MTTDWSAGELGIALPLAERFPVLLRLPGSGVPNPADGANPRMVSGTMALFLPMALSLALLARGKKLRLLGALSALVLLFPLVLSQSPQGALALALGMALVFAYRYPWSLLPQLALAASAAASWHFWHWGLPEALVERLELGIQSRLSIWPVALRMLQDMPFTGIGLNNFPTVQPLYSFSLAIQPHAHNVFLQTALDQGLLGLAAFLALFAMAFYSAWRAYRTFSDPDLRAVVLGCAGGCAAFLGYGLWDSMSLGNKPAVAVWALLGVLSAAGAMAPGEHRAPKFFTPRRLAGLLFGLALLAAITVPKWGSSLLVNAGRVLFNPVALAEGTPDAGRLAQAARLTQAARLAELSLALDANNGRAYLLQGYISALEGEDQAARAAFERGLRLAPQDSHAHLALADACQRLGDNACAIEHWRLAGAYRSLISRGQALYNVPDYPAAGAWFEWAVQVDPTVSDGWRRWLAALKVQAKWEEARETARAYLERFPALSSPYEELAAILMQLQQPEEAGAVVAQGFQTAQPPGAQLYYLRSRLALDGKDYARAELDARQAIALLPANGGYLAWLGELYQRQGRYDEALAQYRRTAQEASTPEWIWRAAQRSGSVYAAQGLWPDAVAEYRQAVAFSEQQAVKSSVLAQNYALLGNVLRQSGELAQAEAAYRQALQLDPQNQAAIKGLDELLK